MWLAGAPPLGVKVTFALTLTLPVRFSLRFALPRALTTSLTTPASLTPIARGEAASGLSRWWRTPLPPRASLPGPGTSTRRIAVPLCLCSFTLPKLNLFEGLTATTPLAPLIAGRSRS